MIPTLSFWITLIGRLAVEAGLLVALAAAAQPWVATPWRRRALWQTALLGIALAWSAELGGWRQLVVRHWPESRPKRHAVVREVEQSMPILESVPVFVAPPPATTLSPSAPVVAPKPVWWPLQLWAAGTMLIGLRALSVRVWLLLVTQRRRRVDDSRILERVEVLRERVGLKRVRVVSWPGLRSPIAFGLWRPTIALPPDFASRFEDEAQEAILAHELAHLAARDPLWLGIADAVLALAWWHPAVWWSRHQLRAACESAADDASALIPGGRVRLADLLVVLGRDLVSPGWTRGLGVAGDGFKSQLARRVTTLLRATHDWRADRSARLGWTRVLALGVTALLVAIPWPGTSGPPLTALIQEARASAVEAKKEATPKTSRFVPSFVTTTIRADPPVRPGNQPTNAIGYEQYSLMPTGVSETAKSPSAGILSSNWINPGSSTYVPIPGFTTAPLPPPPWKDEAWVNAQLDQLVLPEVEILRGTVLSALEKLSNLSTKADPKGLGLMLLLIRDEERPEVSAAVVSERIQLRQITLRKALEEIARASSIPLGLVVDQRFAYLERMVPGKALGQSLIHVRTIPVHGPAFSEHMERRYSAKSGVSMMDAFRAFCRSEGITNHLESSSNPDNPTSLFAEGMDFIQFVGTTSEFERFHAALGRLHLPLPTVRGREAVNAKLDQIVLPSFAIGSRDPHSVIADLLAESRKLDPDQRGVFMVATSGWDFAPRKEADLQKKERNITLRQALQKVVDSFVVSPDGELAFTAEDMGVQVVVRNSTGPATALIEIGDHLELLPTARYLPEDARAAAGLNEQPGDSPGQALIRRRVGSFFVSNFEFGWRSLDEAVQRLNAILLNADPEKKGIKLSVDSPTLKLPRGGSWSAGPLRSALDQLADACSTPVDWFVGDVGVVFRKTANGERPLRTRSWVVDTNAFWAMVRSARPAATGSSTSHQEVKQFLATQGIAFPSVEFASAAATTISTEPQKALMFFDSGRLTVRAKASEIDQIDRILTPVKAKPGRQPVTTLAANHVESPTPATSTPPSDLLERIQKVDARLKELRTHYKDNHPKVQEAIAERMALVGGASTGATNRFVKMEVKLVEIRESENSRLGLDLAFGSAQTNQVAAESGAANGVPVAPEDPRSENYHVDLFRTVSEVATVNSNQFAALLKRLQAEPGTELVSVPSLLADNGRQSVVSVTEEVSMVDGVNAVPGSSTNQAQIRYDTSKVPVGPSVELLPVFVGDSLRMHILAKITEFLGYDQPKPGQAVQTTDAKGKKIEGIQPLPHLRVRMAVADPVLQRGETAVLRGPLVTETVRTIDKVAVLGDVPLLGRLFRTETTNTFKKRLYILVTPTEMDAAGKPK
jgi:beta-lactamase regulating signal transducer with metallopeptidase domain